MTLPVVTLPLPTPPGIANLKNGINGYMYCNGPTVRCLFLPLFDPHQFAQDFRG